MNLPQDWRASVPVVHIPRHPLWIDSYQGAWDLLEHWAAQPDAPLQPETATILHYARYASAVLPLHDWLDQQHVAGLSPLHAWSEWSLYQVTGDAARVSRALPALLGDYARLRDTRRRAGGPMPSANGLYFHAEGECDLGHSPRAPYGWVDLSAQQAIAAELCARMARVAGDEAQASACEAERKELCALIELRCWDDPEQFYTDCGQDGSTQAVKSVAGFWTLPAGLPTLERAQRLAAHLREPEEFWRVHVFAGLSADHPRYSDRGERGRGAVWPFQNYAIIKGLERYSMHDLACRAADNHITTISHVYKETRSHWDHYAPDYVEPGSSAQHDDARTGVSAVALLLETILGLNADAPARTLHWRPTLREVYGVDRLRVGNALVGLRVTPDASRPERIQATLRVSEPLTLHLSTPEGEQWVNVDREVSLPVAVPVAASGATHKGADGGADV